MRVSSGKAKARRLQNYVCSLFSRYLQLSVGKSGDIRPAMMGETGPDVVYQSGRANRLFFSCECSNREVFSWEKLVQSSKNAGGRVPVLFVKRNGWRPVAVLDAESFFQIVSGGVDKPDFFQQLDVEGFVPKLRPVRKLK